MANLEEEYEILMNEVREKIALKLKDGELTEQESERLIAMVNNSVDSAKDLSDNHGWSASGGYRCW